MAEEEHVFEDALERLRCNDPDLTCLDIDLPWVRDDGECPFASALNSNSTLSTLVIRYADIGCKQSVAIFRALRVNFTLRALHLYGIQIGNEGASELADTLKINSVLQKLSLAYNNSFSSEAARLLAGGLRANFALRALNLDGNMIGDKGASAMAGALRANSTLCILKLDGNRIGDEGASAMAGALRVNSTLCILKLGENNIGDNGVRALAGALRFNTTLRKLSIYGMIFSAAGLRPLADALRLNPTLLALDPTITGADGDVEMDDIHDHLRRNVHNARVRATPLKILCWKKLRDVTGVPHIVQRNSRNFRPVNFSAAHVLETGGMIGK